MRCHQHSPLYCGQWNSKEPHAEDIAGYLPDLSSRERTCCPISGQSASLSEPFQDLPQLKKATESCRKLASSGWSLHSDQWPPANPVQMLHWACKLQRVPGGLNKLQQSLLGSLTLPLFKLPSLPSQVLISNNHNPPHAHVHMCSHTQIHTRVQLHLSVGLLRIQPATSQVSCSVQDSLPEIYSSHTHTSGAIKGPKPWKWILLSSSKCWATGFFFFLISKCLSIQWKSEAVES